MNVQKQVEYWRDRAGTSIRSVPLLVERGFWTEALFWLHLGLEKGLKAHVVKNTRKLAPKTHNLSRLADIAGLLLSEQQIQLCMSMNEYQEEARYPDESFPEIDESQARTLLSNALEFHEWLLKTL